MMWLFSPRRALPLALSLTSTTAAAEEVSGRIDADTTWSASDSPYTLPADVTVAEGVRLTIEPGVRVELDEGISLIVAGELVARGTEDDPILFTGQGEGDDLARWGSVVFEDSSVDATYEAIDDYLSGSIVEGCVFEHGTKAVRTHGASPYIHASTFRNGQATPSDTLGGGAGVFVAEGSARASAAAPSRPTAARSSRTGAPCTPTPRRRSSRTTPSVGTPRPTAGR